MNRKAYFGFAKSSDATTRTMAEILVRRVAQLEWIGHSG